MSSTDHSATCPGIGTLSFEYTPRTAIAQQVDTLLGNFCRGFQQDERLSLLTVPQNVAAPTYSGFIERDITLTLWENEVNLRMRLELFFTLPEDILESFMDALQLALGLYANDRTSAPMRVVWRFWLGARP